MALMYTPTENNLTLPEFDLPAMDGNNYSHKDFASKKVKVIMFICNHCPYVKAIEDRIIDLAKTYKNSEVEIIGICSNDSADYPEDSFENLQKTWKEKNYGFVYLYDDSQEVAKNFGAVCTPDIFVFNNSNQLTYRGRLDDSWKDASKVSREDLKLAIEATKNNQSIDFAIVPSMGCSIKWK